MDNGRRGMFTSRRVVAPGVSATKPPFPPSSWSVVFFPLRALRPNLGLGSHSRSRMAQCGDRCASLDPIEGEEADRFPGAPGKRVCRAAFSPTQ